MTVSDDGEGIRPEDLPHVFERFRQGAEASGRPRSLGLGLFLVQGLVELHGGAVTAESEGEGRGARFRVTIPAFVTMPPESQG